MKTIGQLSNQAAVFIYKKDDTAKAAWADVATIVNNSGPIRGELHDDKEELLKGLNEWSKSVDPSNAFLCIYAHMGSPGINCISKRTATLITWKELANALSRGIQLIWLVGCKSKECLKEWAPPNGPVRGLLLTTSESKPWRPLLECFAAEISVNTIYPYDAMPGYLAKAKPEVGKLIGYFKPTKGGFTKAF